MYIQGSLIDPNGKEKLYLICSLLYPTNCNFYCLFCWLVGTKDGEMVLSHVQNSWPKLGLVTAVYTSILFPLLPPFHRSTRAWQLALSSSVLAKTGDRLVAKKELTVLAMNWEPLPPREGFSRERRRKARMEAETMPPQSDTADNYSRANGPKHRSQNTRQKKRKPNRPGFNSYLKVILDDKSMDQLHKVAQKIQSKVRNMQPNFADQPAADEDESQDEKTEHDHGNGDSLCEQGFKNKEKKAQPLRFIPRSRASLHMTLFFGGEALCELPADELQDWHTKISQRLEESKFYNVGEMNHPITEEAAENDFDEFNFVVTELTTFPPKRNNLVVAILEATAPWHQLHDDIRNLARSVDSEGLKDITSSSKDKWTAHITLGNIIGGGKSVGKKEIKKVLGEISGEYSAKASDESNAVAAEKINSKIPRVTSATSNAFLFRAKTRGISMGGPVPQQVKLNWDFMYCPNSKRMPYNDT